MELDAKPPIRHSYLTMTNTPADTKRFSSTCPACKTFHTKLITDYRGANWNQRRINCECGERLQLSMVGPSKGYRKAPHKCNASCQHAEKSTECNCECGGLHHGARAGNSAPKAI